MSFEIGIIPRELLRDVREYPIGRYFRRLIQDDNENRDRSIVTIIGFFSGAIFASVISQYLEIPKKNYEMHSNIILFGTVMGSCAGYCANKVYKIGKGRF